MPKQNQSLELVVTLRVRYDLHGTSPKDVQDQLDFAIEMLANRGLLTGDLPAEVAEWSHDLTVADAQPS